MKKLFFFLLPLLVFACKGVEQYQAPINELSTNWDSSTRSITDFQAEVSNDLTVYTQSLAAMQPDDAAKAKMKPADITAWEAAQKSVTDALGAYAPFQKTINDFVKVWAEKSSEVTALKDGLAAGKLEGDVNAKITELNGMVATGNENLTSWKASYASLKGNVEAAFANVKQMQTTGGTGMMN